MGTINPGGLVNPSAVVDRYYVGLGTPYGYNLYINSSTGSDYNAGTSASAPYRTIAYAMGQIPYFSNDDTFLIHLLGAASHIVPDGFVLPSMLNPEGIVVKPLADGFRNLAPLTFRATPTLVLAVPAINIISQAADPVSGLRPIVTNLALVPSAYAGLWVADSLGTMASVRTNDGTTLFVANSVPLVGPLSVYARSAVIVPANPFSSQPTIDIRGGSAPILFQGVRIAAPLGGGSLGASGLGPILLEACDLKGTLQVGASGSALSANGYIQAQACNFENLRLRAGVWGVSGCYVKGGTVLLAAPKMTATASHSIFEDMVSPLFSDGSGVGPSFMQLEQVEILNSAGNAVAIVGRPMVSISSVKITGAGGQNIVMTSCPSGDTVSSDVGPIVVATINDAVKLCDATTGAVTMALPQLSSARGLTLTIVKSDASANPVNITPFLGDFVNGAAVLSLLNQYDSLTLVAGPSEWNAYGGIAGGGGGAANVNVESLGVLVGTRPTINFVGATVTDNPGFNRVDITITGGLPTSVYVCPAGVLVNDFVYISAANTVDRANATSSAAAPAIGVVVSKPSATSALVMFGASEVGGFAGLAPGAAYYIATIDGAISTLAPGAVGNIVQRIGRARSATVLLVQINEEYTVL